MRVFVALEMDPEPRRYLSECVAALRRKLPGKMVWVGEENLHITLRFLGELPPEKVVEVENALREIHAPPCPFEPVVWGAFPDAKRPRVLWVGCKPEEEERIAELVKMVESRLHSIGIPRETKPFRAHVTVARVKEAVRGAQEAFGQVPLRDIGTSKGERFVLMQSVLTPTGSVYTPLAHFALEKGSEDDHGRRA